MENHERKQASSPYSPNACGKLISCMEKLEKLSRRLERIPDNDQSRQPKSLFKPFRLNQVSVVTILRAPKSLVLGVRREET